MKRLLNWFGKLFEPLPEPETEFEKQVRLYCAAVDSLCATLGVTPSKSGPREVPKRRYTIDDIEALVAEACASSARLLSKHTFVPLTVNVPAVATEIPSPRHFKAAA